MGLVSPYLDNATIALDDYQNKFAVRHAGFTLLAVRCTGWTDWVPDTKALDEEGTILVLAPESSARATSGAGVDCLCSRR
jgi:hypothetical protein